jgi:hypothetical protein
MIKTVLTFALIALLLSSCDGYQQSPHVSTDYLTSLNDTVSYGQKNGAVWVNSPEEIAKHFFPPLSHDGGSKMYKINKKVNSSTECKVTIQEGPIDDEVLGERHTLYFRQTDGLWMIIDLKNEIKRRS